MALPAADLPPLNPTQLVPSARETFKSMHRFRFISTMAVAVNPIAALVFGLMIITGLMHYFRLLASRSKVGRGASSYGARADGGGICIAGYPVVAGLLVIVLTVSGLGLAINCFGQELYIKPIPPLPVPSPPAINSDCRPYRMWRSPRRRSPALPGCITGFIALPPA